VFLVKLAEPKRRQPICLKVIGFPAGIVASTYHGRVPFFNIPASSVTAPPNDDRICPALWAGFPDRGRTRCPRAQIGASQSRIPEIDHVAKAGVESPHRQP
jgi:hypothetical protein